MSVGYLNERGDSSVAIITWALEIEHLTAVQVLLYILDHHNCSMPLELWLDERKVKGNKLSAIRAHWRVICRSRINDASPIDFAADSEYKNLLLLNPYNIPVRCPNYLFTDPLYQCSGLLLWVAPKGVSFQSIANLDIDLGQCLISRQIAQSLSSRNESSALLWQGMCKSSILNESGIAFNVVESLPTLLTTRDFQSDRAFVWCQSDSFNERIFQNREMIPWRSGGINPMVPGFFFEAACLKYLKTVKRVTPKCDVDNQRFEAIRRSISARPYILHIENLARFEPNANLEKQDDGSFVLDDGFVLRLNVKDYSEREVLLSEDGTVSLGAHEDFLNWSLAEQSGEPILNFFSGTGISAQLTKCDEETWKGKHLQSHQVLILKPLSLCFPALKPQIYKDSAIHTIDRSINVINSSNGIGDAVSTLYACVGAANRGMNVNFITPHVRWFERISHIRLNTSLGWSAAGAIDVHQDYSTQLRHGTDRPLWYASYLGPGIIPDRPDDIDCKVRTPRFDFDPYIILIPFTTSKQRDWPSTHWARLAYLLYKEGFEVVALGTRHESVRLAEAFSDTSAYWVVGHPPDWIIDAILGATAVIGNDSGLTHVAGLLDKPTFAVHAQLPPELLWSCSSVDGIMPRTKCVCCRTQYSNGYTDACKAECSALATISPEAVVERVVKTLLH